MVERKFHRIGHGGFITEKINSSINIVYDCGSKPGIGRTKLREKINSHFFQDEEIEAVFISHYHEDHINELEHLMRRCNVKNMILPLLNPFDRVLYLASQNIIYGSFVARLIEDPVATLLEFGVTNIIQVSESDTFVVENEDVIYLDNPNNLSGSRIINGNSNIGINSNINWCFKTFNPRRQFDYQNYRTAIAGININNPINYVTFERLRSIYRSLYDPNLNQRSMTLYSGPLRIGTNNITYSQRGDSYVLNHPAGALYLGDYVATYNSTRFSARSPTVRELMQRYSNVWENIKIIQVPHHASIDNHSEILYSNTLIAAIFADYRTHHHPNQAILSDLRRLGVRYRTLAVRARNHNRRTSFPNLSVRCPI